MTVATDRPQPLVALAKANEVRLAHARTKEWIAGSPDAATSRQRASRLLLDPSSRPYTGSLRIVSVLLAVRGLGVVKARRILRRRGVYERRTIDSLTRDQRTLLAADIQGPAR